MQQSLNSFKNWSQTVTNTNIYEKFLHHLQTWFSIENLLFITEYMQIKNVLKQKYSQLEQLIKDNVSIGFDIEFI